MASSASFTTTRRSRVLHWLFPSRRAMLAVAAVDVATSVLGLPLPLHLVVGLVAHVVIALVG